MSTGPRGATDEQQPPQANRQTSRRGERRSSGVLSAPLVPNMSGPVLGRANIAYELSARTKATAHGGIGMIAKLVDAVGLAGEIDASLQLLKLHRPYHESDHVLNIAYNACAAGSAWRTSRPAAATRCSSTAWGPRASPTRPPPGTSAAASTHASILALQEAINRARLKVWRRQPASFFARPAVIDADAIDRADRRASPSRAWTSPTTASGGTRRWWSRSPTPKSRCSWACSAPTGPATRAWSLLRPGDRPVPPGRVQRDPPAGRHRLLAHRPSSTAGTTTACGSSSATTPRPTSSSTPRAADEEIYHELVTRAERQIATTAAHAPAQRQGRHRPRARLQDAAPDGRGRRRVLLPARQLQAGLPGRRAAQEHLGRARRERPVRRVPLLLLHHQRPGHDRRRGDRPRPASAATRRTSSASSSPACAPCTPRSTPSAPTGPT